MVVSIILLSSVINLKQLVFAQSDTNQTSIDSEVNLLEKAFIPIAVAIIGVIATTLTVFWSNIQAHNRRQSFQRLIFRELEEVSPYPPYPKEKKHGMKWYQHQKRKFIHQEIFKDSTQNRDFIFSLDPSVVYYVTQLWDTIKPCHDDPQQWLYYLHKIALYSNNSEIKKAWVKWAKIIISYDTSINGHHLQPEEVADNIAGLFIQWTNMFHSNVTIYTDEPFGDKINIKYSFKNYISTRKWVDPFPKKNGKTSEKGKIFLEFRKEVFEEAKNYLP